MEPNEQERFINEWLDTALKRRGAVAPRLGLEDRVLASLRAESSRMPASAWSWRSAWIVLAVTVLIAAGALFLARRSGSNQQVAIGPGVSTNLKALTTPESRGPLTATNAVPSRRRRQVSFPSPAVTHATAIGPKLEQFPSPQPLSEQEQILALYVQHFPWEAVLMARVQTALFTQESVDQQQAEPSVEVPNSSGQLNP